MQYKVEGSPRGRAGTMAALACLAGSTACTQALAPQAYGVDPLRFEACPPELPAAELGECALVEVPLDWNDADDSRRITLFVRRFQGVDNPGGVRQAWALDGGPGFAGDTFTDPAIRDVFVEAGYDLYIPTHRGTVYGTGLACPRQQSPTSAGQGRVTPEEFPDCVAALRTEWGDDLAHFDSWAASHDVRHLMERSGVSSERPAVVYGGSYGSYWGQRLLQVAPDLLTGVWLDSVVDLEASFERADVNSNDAGMRLLHACEHSSACADHLPTSVDELASRVTGAYANHEGCAQGDRDLAQLQALFHRLLSSRPSDQALVAPLLVRADRCSTADAAAIDHALTELVTPPSSSPAQMPPPAYNPVLNKHIMLAELFRYDRAPEEVAETSRRHLFSVRADSFMASLAPAYQPPLRRELPSDTPTSSAHLVLWQGGIDPLDRAEWAQQTAERWGATKVSLVELPFAGHSVVRYAVAEDGTRCALEMLDDFLAEPSADLNRTCLGRMSTFDIEAQSEDTIESAQRWFGTTDVWGEEQSPP